ncbi:MAG: hypothetical protein KAT77_05330 [Nanoarchaeota archaeon]|nr:hypothetical protein [Nanoarchaeota archaeon]
MQKLIFKKKVSKGSRFNQIYIPKNMECLIEVGDEVEVKLIKKHTQLFYSNIKTLSNFKEEITQKIFSFLSKFNLSSVFIVGSFLTQKINYHDIDIVIITQKKDQKSEQALYHQLIEKINLNLHLLFIPQERFEHLLKACPLTRSMFNQYLSNKKTNLGCKKIIDKKHLNFLLMMPEDLLEITLNSRVFFDNLRRLITIERFLENKDSDIDKINKNLENLIGQRLYQRMKNNQEIEEKTIEDLRRIIKIKLNQIRKLIQNG